MAETTATFTEEQLLELIGPVGLDEYKSAADHARPGLAEWVGALRDLSDDALYEECRRWIYEGALVQRFRSNFEDVHCRSTACCFEARRRSQLTGHQDVCSTIYSRAYSAVVTAEGYPGMASEDVCVCEAVSDV